VPSWIALEIVPTKLPHYSLPLFPALAVVCVFSLSSLKDAGRLTTISAWLGGALSIILGVVLVGAPLYFSGSAPLLAAVGALCAVGVAFLTLSRKSLAFSREGVALPLLQAVVFFPILFYATLPNLGPFWSSRELTQVVEIAQKEIQLHSGATVRARVASSGYGEPSFVFLNGTNTLLTDGAGAAKFLNETCDSVTLVTAKELAPFSDALRALGRTPAVEGPTSVFNYSKGKWVSVYHAIRVGCE
jgi:4-amino-4-deoxy-L-arabinose transferase-like glycosyltransferase